jgi:hypothetical protein
MLHRGDRRTLTTKQVRETEAEAVAFFIEMEQKANKSYRVLPAFE